MRRSWSIVSVLGLLAMGAAGCQENLKNENVELRQEVRDLQAKLNDTEGRLRSAPDPTQVASMQQELAARDARINELQSQLRQPVAGQPGDSSAFSGIEVTRNDREGTLTVNLPGDVLFDSGKSDLKPSARTTLGKVVAAIKKDYGNKPIMVDGYTDSDPINRSKDKWKDNLDLSAERARTVAGFLVEQGINTRLVHPRGMNDTHAKANKAASRRVEIVVATR